jgi:hypothetical protein
VLESVIEGRRGSAKCELAEIAWSFSVRHLLKHQKSLPLQRFLLKWESQLTHAGRDREDRC